MFNKILYSLALTLTLSSTALASEGKTTVGVGIEAFHDRYREPDIDVYTRSDYGSVTGYVSYEQSNIFGSFDGRASYGTTDYKSSSGSVSGIPEWEFEGRGRIGYSFPLGGGTLSPYTGIGVRYFMQEGKNRYTTLYAGAYDRRILQTYLPVGASYAFITKSGWTITPQAEVDFLLYGDVNSRLANVSSAYSNVSNRQDAFSGYGIRGELMFGKAAKSYSWQIGPFVRYWNVEDSKVSYDTNGTGWIEPQNDRVQAGVALRILW